MAVSRDTPSPLSVDRDLPLYTQALDFLSASEPLNVTSAVAVWDLVLVLILEVLAPLEGTSIFYPILTANQLSSFRIYYDGTTGF